MEISEQRPGAPAHDDAVWLTLPRGSASAGAALLATAATKALELDDIDLAQRMMVLLSQPADGTAAQRPGDDHALVELGLEFDVQLARLMVVSNVQEGSHGRTVDEALAPDASGAGVADRLERVAGGSIRATLDLHHRAGRSLKGEQTGLDITFHGPLFVRDVIPRALLQTLGDRDLARLGDLALLGDRIASAMLSNEFERLRLVTAVQGGNLLIRLRYMSVEQAGTVCSSIRDDFPRADLRQLDGGPDDRPAEVACSLPLASGSGGDALE